VTAMRFAVVAHRLSDTNLHLAAIAGGEVLSPREALLGLGAGDVALARLDVLESVDGVEPGIPELERLANGGVTVLNPPSTLLACHDKLLTARALRRARLPHPRTIAFAGGSPPLEFPCVLKPRFGSWGRKVELCDDEEQLRHNSRRERPWLVQELVPPLGYDLRLVVAGGRVVGAGRRTAAAGEWRTNVALGATVTPVIPPLGACEIAVAAADAVGASLVGVDLLPVGQGRWTIIELNGAVDLRPVYALGRDLYVDVVEALLGERVMSAA
jgi:RimK family alpha-L-glutamate ligase